MNGLLAKKLRRAADLAEVRGTPQWRRFYKELKRQYRQIVKDAQD